TELPSGRKYTPLGSTVKGKRFSNGSAILNWIICLFNGMTGIGKFNVSLNVGAHGPAQLITIGALYSSLSVITPLTFLPSFVISFTSSYIYVAPSCFFFFILSLFFFLTECQLFASLTVHLTLVPMGLHN